jgi:hypothetical protein
MVLTVPLQSKGVSGGLEVAAVLQDGIDREWLIAALFRR